MADSEFTISDLKAAIGNAPSIDIMLAMAFAKTHEDRLGAVEQAIDYVADELVKNRHVHQDKTEDGLSIDFVTHLRTMGFQASHDTQYGGHCDIVVEGKAGFLWIAEAKIHSSYDWLLKGFEQLDRRYSTGMPGQDAGEMLIYCFVPRLDKVMDTYQSRLQEKRADVKFDNEPDGALTRRSIHVHEGTGQPFRVRHKGVPLFFKPTV